MFWLRIFAFSPLGAAATPVRNVTFPISPSAHAVIVPPNFVGIGFESAFLDQFNNALSENLVDSLAARMSAPPVIRVGGTSGDTLKFNPSQKQTTVCIASSLGCPYQPYSDFIIGPTYFNTFAKFQRAQFSIQAPLQAALNISEIVSVVTRAYNAVGASRVAAIAVGNEAGYYESTAQDYVIAAHTAQAAILKALKLSNGTQIFEVLDMPNEFTTWSVEDAFNAGLNSNNETKLAAHHWYQIWGFQAGYTLQNTLMNHTAIVSKWQTVYAPANKFLRSKGIPYIISEIGSILKDALPWSSMFGATLWSVDLQLYVMAQGVARINFTQRPRAEHALWVPIAGVPESPGPQVRAPYYALPFVADFVGNSSIPTMVQEMDLKSDVFTAYGAYVSGHLARVAVINLREWSSSMSIPRSNQTFVLTIPGNITSIRVARLHADNGAQARGYDANRQNITYAGMQWSAALDQGRGHLSGQPFDTVAVVKGYTTITLPDSEAVLVYLR